MNIKKHLLFFLLRFLPVYLVLLLPLFRDAYADFYRTTGQQLFGSFGEKGAIRFKEKKEKTDEDVQTTILLFNEKVYQKNKASNTRLDVAYIENNWLNDYLGVALLLALIAATPIGWKRKLFALGGGLLLVHLYLAFAQWVAFLYQFHIHPELQVLQLSGFSKDLIFFFNTLLNQNPGTIVFASLTIWILSVIRKSDWENMMKLKE